MIVEAAMMATSFLPEFITGLLPDRLSEYLGDFFDESFFLPAYKGPLILIVGGSAMLALTLVLSLMVQNRHMNMPNPTLANQANSYPHRHHLRQQQAHSAYASKGRDRAARGPSSPSPVQSVKKPKNPSKATDKKRKQRADASKHPSWVHESHLEAKPPKESPQRPRAVHESRLVSSRAKQPGPSPTEAKGPRPQSLQNTMPHPAGAAKKKRPATVTRKSLRTMKKAAKQAGLGSGDHLIAPGGRHAIRLTRCRSCRDAGTRDAGCESERVLLQNALRENDPRGQVVERTCDPHRPGRCSFEIIPGGSR